jgi:exopolysaccharide biosynthesis polyprenyl glycosylphosphotransferase
VTARRSAPIQTERRPLETERPRPGAALRIHHRTRDYALRRLLAIADAIAVAFALSAAFLIPDDRSLDKLAWGLLLLPVWILVFKVYGLYDREGRRVSRSTINDAPPAFHALLVGSLLFWLLTELVPALALTRIEAVAFFVTALTAILVARVTARWIGRRIMPAERTLFVGGGDIARLLVHKIRVHPEYALMPVGYVEGPGAEAAELDGTLPYLGPLSELERVCAHAQVERIVVASPAVEESALADLVRVARGLDVQVSILPQLSDVLGPSVTIDEVEGVTILGLSPPALSRSSRMLKRAMDLLLASVVLVVSAPVMLAAALAIKLTSRGPVLFRQERVGKEGRHFWICKFRTMVPDAEGREAELRASSAHPAWLLLDHDPRITNVGRVLRRTSLDELPQLWNVIRGDMSLVGPRPMPPAVDERMHGWERRRLDLTPGITGLWQVLGRTRIPFEEMLKLDYLYVTNWSLWQDVRLLVQTLPAVIRQRGAN